jgi:hypothetical protein
MPKDLRALVQDCWRQDANDRPPIADVVHRISEIEEDFSEDEGTSGGDDDDDDDEASRIQLSKMTDPYADSAKNGDSKKRGGHYEHSRSGTTSFSSSSSSSGSLYEHER